MEHNGALNEKCLPLVKEFEHLVLSWWCCLRNLGSVTLLEEVSHWGWLTPLPVCCLFLCLWLVEDMSSQLPVMAAMAAPCCYASLP